MEQSPRPDPAGASHFCLDTLARRPPVAGGRGSIHGGSAHGWEDCAGRVRGVGAVAGRGPVGVRRRRRHPVREAGRGRRRLPGRRRQGRRELRRAPSTSASRTTARSRSTSSSTPPKRARSRQAATRSAPRSRTPTPASQRMKERQEILDQEALAKTVAEEGLKGTKFEGRSVVTLPGDTVIQRANTFTDVVGPSGATTTARFLYVEAFNKSTKITGNSSVSGPTLAAVVTRAPTASTARPANMNRFVDTDPTPDVYMYHRQLIRLPARRPGEHHERPHRHHGDHGWRRGAAWRPTRSRSGSARTSRRTSRATRTSRSSRTTRTRPRTARDLDALAAAVPRAGVGREHARDDRRATSASRRRSCPGPTPSARLRPRRPAPRSSTPRVRSRPPRRSPGSRSPRPRARPILATVDGDPVRLDRPHPAPSRTRPAPTLHDGRHGHEPGGPQPHADHGRHVHVRDLGLPGRPRRLHVQDPAGDRHRRDGAGRCGRAHLQGVGPPRR